MYKLDQLNSFPWLSSYKSCLQDPCCLRPPVLSDHTFQCSLDIGFIIQYLERRYWYWNIVQDVCKINSVIEEYNLCTWRLMVCFFWQGGHGERLRTSRVASRRVGGSSGDPHRWPGALLCPAHRLWSTAGFPHGAAGGVLCCAGQRWTSGASPAWHAVYRQIQRGWGMVSSYCYR